MCTTTQFLFQCRHEATTRFRVGICGHAGSPSCQIEKTIITIPKVCHNCKRAARKVDPALAEKIKHMEYRDQHDAIPPLDYTWHIPTRCFHDPGFARLDPFAADRAKQSRTISIDDEIISPRSGASIKPKASNSRGKWQEFKRPGRFHFFQEQLSQSLIGGCCHRHRVLAMRWRGGRTPKKDTRTLDDRCTSFF